MNLEKETENIFLVVLGVIALAVLIYFIGANYTGFAVFGGELFFDNNSNYISENINFSDSEMKLIPNILIENITIEYSFNYYISEAEYDHHDVTNLIKIIDSNYVSMHHDRLEFELENDKTFINNQTVSLYILNGSGFVYLCKSNGQCSYNGTNFIGGFQYDGKEGFYNITIINQSTEKKKLYLVGNIKLDYIYMIEKNTTIESIEKTFYPDEGYIETNNIEINELKNFSLFSNYSLNNQEIKFYYYNESWNEINGEIPILKKIKAVFISNTTETPILYNMSLKYNLNCYESWTCSNWTDCFNETKTRRCNDTNECDTIIARPDLTEYCNISIENQTNVTIPSAPSGGSSGGGGGSRIPKEETRVLEQPVQKEIVTTPETTRILEQKVDLCKNEIKDQDETGIDCGGSCPKCNSILTILPYTNYLLFVMLLLVILTLLDKGRKAIKNENSDS